MHVTPYESGRWVPCDTPPPGPGLYEWRHAHQSGELLVLPDATWGLAGVVDKLVPLDGWEDAWVAAGYELGARGHYWSLPRPTLPPPPTASSWREPAKLDGGCRYVAELRIDGRLVGRRERLSNAPAGMCLATLADMTRQLAASCDCEGEAQRLIVTMEVK